MNKTRRKELNALQDRMTALQFSDLFDELRAIAEALESLRDEEQESFDNLPEALQDGDRGQDMQAAIDAMTEAYDALDALESPQDALDEAFSRIEDAKG